MSVDMGKGATTPDNEGNTTTATTVTVNAPGASRTVDWKAGMTYAKAVKAAKLGTWNPLRRQLLTANGGLVRPNDAVEAGTTVTVTRRINNG